MKRRGICVVFPSHWVYIRGRIVSAVHTVFADNRLYSLIGGICTDMCIDRTGGCAHYRWWTRYSLIAFVFSSHAFMTTKKTSIRLANMYSTRWGLNSEDKVVTFLKKLCGGLWSWYQKRVMSKKEWKFHDPTPLFPFIIFFLYICLAAIASNKWYNYNLIYSVVTCRNISKSNELGWEKEVDF